MGPDSQLFSALAQVGGGGLLAFLIIREVLRFLTKRRVNDKHIKNSVICRDSESFVELKRQVNDLHKWHDMSDSDGVKIWYVRRSLEDAIEKLATNIGTQTRVLQDLCTSVHDVSKDVHDIRRTKP